MGRQLFAETEKIGSEFEEETDPWIILQVCRRRMTIPGVGKLTALALAAVVDDPKRFRCSRDIGAYLGNARGR
jgi:transposase